MTPFMAGGRRNQLFLRVLKGSCMQKYIFYSRSPSQTPQNTPYDIAFIQDYSAVPPSMLSEDDGDTRFHCLMLEDLPTSMRFISPEFVCAAFFVKTDDNCINCYLLNDLVDNMYFQLGQ